jgi:hypothetical protein
MDGGQRGATLRRVFSFAALTSSEERSASTICLAMSSSSVPVAARVERCLVVQVDAKNAAGDSTVRIDQCVDQIICGCDLLTTAADQAQCEDQSRRALRAHNDSPQIIHGGAEMAVNGPGDYQLNQ